LLPRTLATTDATQPPAGWSAMFARLKLRPDSRVLVLPYPEGLLTQAMRWAAQTGEPSSMIGGYFIGDRPGSTTVRAGLMTHRFPAYLNYLWAEGVPPGSPYSFLAAPAIAQWTERPGLTGKLVPAQREIVHVHAALTVLASWRPQAVVADATANSPLGEYLTKVLGRPTVTVDGLIGWRITALPAPQPDAGLAAAHPRHVGRPGEPRRTGRRVKTVA